MILPATNHSSCCELRACYHLVHRAEHRGGKWILHCPFSPNKLLFVYNPLIKLRFSICSED